MLLPHLDDEFAVEDYPGIFPDCTARRNGKRIGIEFEVSSKDFLEHEHDKDPALAKCDLIVCWKNDLEPVLNVRGQPIDVLELSKVVKEKGLSFVLGRPRPPVPEWEKERFLHELRANVREDEVYSWTKALVEFCEGCPEFAIAPGAGRQATLGFQVRKWLSKRIGVPTPILFYADGCLGLDYKDMPAPVERELRSRTGERKKRWHKINIQDQKTFDMLREALRWLAESVNAM